MPADANYTPHALLPQHPDLKDNLWINTKEIPGNGVDDDGNGEGWAAGPGEAGRRGGAGAWRLGLALGAAVGSRDAYQGDSHSCERSYQGQAQSCLSCSALIRTVQPYHRPH